MSSPFSHPQFRRMNLVSAIVFSFAAIFLAAVILQAAMAVFSGVDGRATAHRVFGVEVAHATNNDEVTIRDARFKARYVGQSIPDPIRIEAGKTVTVNYRFKNVGTATWQPEHNFISAYTMKKREQPSDFAGPNWISSKQTAKVTTAVAPGEIATIALQFTAPNTAGEYTEYFHLAAEDYTWIENGYFWAKITVVPAKTSDEPRTDTSKKTDEDDVKDGAAPSIAAKAVTQNIREIDVVGGEQVKLVAIYQNSGQTTWDEYSVVANAPTALASVRQLSFADTSWQSSTRVKTRKKEIAANGYVRETMYFRAPATKGEYTARFALQVGDQVFDSDAAEVTVTVTEDAPDHYEPPTLDREKSAVSTDAPRLSEEPRIRVGLWKNPEESVQFRSFDDDYVVYAGEKEKGVLPKAKLGTLSYLGGEFFFAGGDLSFQTSEFVRLAPQEDEHAAFVLLNYKRRVSWKGPANFNRYRGALEYRETEDADDRYIINELLMEDYMKGIGENANRSPMEYLKSQAVAQRTYAYYIAEHSTKHDKRFFDVVATTGDQLYLGYENERIMPRFVEAVEDTRGQMVTYDLDDDETTPTAVVITPYFGNTDGRTRGWHEVWGGTVRPWLVSVRAEYDARDGKHLFGHGVGMSQRDAAIRADEEGLDWKELLTYYYTDTEVVEMYR